MFPASTPSFFMVGLLGAMGVRAEPSLICTLPGSCGLSYLQDEVETLSLAGHPPPDGSCSLSSLQDEVRALPGSWAHSPSDAYSLSSLRDEVWAVPGG